MPSLSIFTGGAPPGRRSPAIWRPAAQVPPSRMQASGICSASPAQAAARAPARASSSSSVTVSARHSTDPVRRPGRQTCRSSRTRGSRGTITPQSISRPPLRVLGAGRSASSRPVTVHAGPLAAAPAANSVSHWRELVERHPAAGDGVLAVARWRCRPSGVRHTSPARTPITMLPAGPDRGPSHCSNVQQHASLAVTWVAVPRAVIRSYSSSRAVAMQPVSVRRLGGHARRPARSNKQAGAGPSSPDQRVLTGWPGRSARSTRRRQHLAQRRGIQPGRAASGSDEKALVHHESPEAGHAQAFVHAGVARWHRTGDTGTVGAAVGAGAAVLAWSMHRQQVIVGSRGRPAARRLARKALAAGRFVVATTAAPAPASSSTLTSVQGRTAPARRSARAYRCAVSAASSSALPVHAAGLEVAPAAVVRDAPASGKRAGASPRRHALGRRPRAGASGPRRNQPRAGRRPRPCQ